MRTRRDSSVSLTWRGRWLCSLNVGLTIMFHYMSKSTLTCQQKIIWHKAQQICHNNLMRNNQEFMCNKQMWSVAALCFCFAMVSGQMWNQIRRPPFCHWSKNGPVCINDGLYGQYVLESYIVAILNAAVVMGMILMIEAAGGVNSTEPRSAAEGKRRRFQSVQSVVGLVLLCVFFSLLLSVFRAKLQGYPYSL